MASQAANTPAERWLDEAVRVYQRVAGVRPATYAELYERLADLVENTPRPRNKPDEMCGRHLLREACLRLTASVLGEHLSAADALLRWPALWSALTLIGRADWNLIAAELRELARQNRGPRTLPERVELYVRAHFTETCTLIDVERNVGASVRVLTKSFRHHHSCTVHQFLSSLRLRAAVRLLDESDLKIWAICVSVGYRSHVALYRQLHRFTRLTPAAVRGDPTVARAVLRSLDEWLSAHGLAA